MDFKTQYEYIIDELEALLDNASKDNIQKDKQLSEQKSIINQLRQFRDNYNNEYQLLSDKFDRLSEELRESHKTMVSPQNYILLVQVLSDKLEVKCRELQVISQMNEELQNQTKALNEETNEKITESKSKCNQLEAKVEELTTKCVFLSEQNQRQTIEINDSKQRLLELETERESTLNQIDSLENEIFEEKQKVLSSEQQIQTLNESLDKKTEENESLGQHLNTLSEQLVKTEEERDLIQNKIELLNTKLTEAKTTFDEKCREYDIIFAQNRGFKKQMENIHKEYEKTISDLKTRLNTEEMSSDIHRINKERYANENMAYLKMIKNFETEIQRLTDLSKKPSEGKCPQQNCMNQIMSSMDISELTNKWRELKTISQMNEELKNQSKALNEEFSEKITELNSKCNQLETNVEELTTNCNSLSEQNQNLIKKMSDLSEQFMNPNNLIALKKGKCDLEDSLKDDDQRLLTLQKRNSKEKPHLRSSYAVELPFMKENVSLETVREGHTCMPLKDSNQMRPPSDEPSRRYKKQKLTFLN